MQTSELSYLLALAVALALLVGLAAGALVMSRLSARRLDDQRQLDQQQAALALQTTQHQAGLEVASLSQSLEQARDQQQQLQHLLENTRQELRLDQQQLSEQRQLLAAAQERNRQLEGLPAQLAERDQALSALKNEFTEQRTRFEQQRLHFEEQLKLLQDAKVDLGREFENVANRIFENKHQQFSANSKSLLETTLDPIKTQLGEFRRKVEEVYEKENLGRSLLAQQVVELQKQAQKIGEDAVNLAQALKGSSKTQGNWGEVVLERLLEQSGLQKGREYDTQKSFVSESGSRLMPDVIVHLPESKDIIIDAKVSLVDYEKYCNSEDESERQLHLAAHVQSLRNHIRQLSVKDYEKLEGIKTLDFVFIFIPIEAAFLFALQKEPGLYREAYDRHIILVSPTTLLATLRTIQNIWRYENQNRNAELIAAKAGGLHDQFVMVLAGIEEVGKHLDKSRDAWEKTTKRLHTGNGNLVRRVDELRLLGAKTKKAIDRELLEQVDDDISRELIEAEVAGLPDESDSV